MKATYRKHPRYYYARLLWAKSMRLCSWGCHQMPERSFFFRQYQFPVCARCCGVTIGTILGYILFYCGFIVSVPIALLSMLLMFADWAIQWLDIKESTNTRRLITGIFGGLGCTSLYLKMLRTISRIIRNH